MLIFISGFLFFCIKPNNCGFHWIIVMIQPPYLVRDYMPSIYAIQSEIEFIFLVFFLVFFVFVNKIQAFFFFRSFFFLSFLFQVLFFGLGFRVRKPSSCVWAESINLMSCLAGDTIKELMSYPKCRSVTVINNPARPGSNHKEVNCINYN